MLDQSVSERVLSDSGRGLCLLLLPQQEVNHLLQQSLRCHLPDDPVQQGCGGQDAHLGPTCSQKHSRHDTLTAARRQDD